MIITFVFHFCEHFRFLVHSRARNSLGLNYSNKLHLVEMRANDSAFTAAAAKTKRFCSLARSVFRSVGRQLDDVVNFSLETSRSSSTPSMPCIAGSISSTEYDFPFVWVFHFSQLTISEKRSVHVFESLLWKAKPIYLRQGSSAHLVGKSRARLTHRKWNPRLIFCWSRNRIFPLYV